MKALILFAIFGLASSANAYTPMNGSARPSINPRMSSGGPVVYYGGPVLKQVKLYVVFWGSKVDANSQKTLPGFYQSLVNSDYLDFLKQYSTKDMGIGRGTLAGVKVITPINKAKALKQKDVENELIAQMESGALPASDANSLYMIHFPPGVKIFAFGGYSCQRWCGDHEAIKNHPKYGNVAYAMIPDMGGSCSFGCTTDGKPFSGITITASHEVAEAITDPVSPGQNEPNAFPAGWISADQNEIGDLCPEGKSTLKTPTATYVIQDEWDNSTNSCKSGIFTSAK